VSGRILLRLVTASVVLALLGSCGSSAPDFVSPTPPPTPPPLVPFFQTSGTSPGPNQVRLTGTPIGSGKIRLDVIVGGPTTSTDIYAFAFDLVLGDRTVANYVASSETFGPALSTSTCSGKSLLVSRSGDRIVIGLSKLGSCPGNGVPAGESVVLSLTLQVFKAGSCSIRFEGSPLNAQNPVTDPSAIDSTSKRIDTIAFDATPAVVGA
jgi:hypothetical protein